MILLFLIPLCSGVLIEPGVLFEVGNQYYSVNQTLNFTNINISSSYILFNESGFYVDSANDINITLIFINSSMVTAGPGDKVMDFYADTASGLVQFNISGFPPSTNYSVNRSGTQIDLLTSNASGFISFSNNVWSQQRFEIFQTSETPNLPPSISSPVPSNDTTGVSVNISNLYMYINDPNDDNFDWNLTTSPNIGSCSGNSETDGNKSCSIAGLDYNTSYEWTVVADDGSNSSSATYTFTTESSVPTISLVSPSNGASTTDTTPTFSFSVSDPDDETVNCSLYVGGSVRASGSNLTANGSTYQLTSSSLSLNSYSWYVNCTDGTTAQTSSSRTITIEEEDDDGGGGGGNGGGGGSGGGGGGGTPPPTPYNFTHSFNLSTEEISEIIENNRTAKEALEIAEVETEDSEQMNRVYAGTMNAHEHCVIKMGTVHVNAETLIDVTLECNESVSNLILIVEIPKSFASHSDNISVEAGTAEVVILETDPVYSIFEEEASGSIRYYFTTNAYLNREDIANAWTQPLLFAIEDEKEPECGNGLIEEGEECDTAIEVTGGIFYCTEECELEEIPLPECVDDGNCTEEERALNCTDCLMPVEFKCVDDGFCTQEEQEFNCTDCMEEPVPEEPGFKEAVIGLVVLIAFLILVLVVIFFAFKNISKNKEEENE